ncbi:MAG: 50S ribosomal protein L9 [Clostridia bacterium]|nr:50S ribosomal protein L9 [Clostridia bacterium]
MKVILKIDVKNLGKKDQMVEVSDGYGRNYLIPRGLAMEATAANINTMKDRENARANRQKREEDAALSFKEKLDGKTVDIKAKAGENGKLFGAVAAKDISEAIEKQFRLSIDKKKIQLEEPIKSVGVRDVVIKLHTGISATVKVAVTAG